MCIILLFIVHLDVLAKLKYSPLEFLVLFKIFRLEFMNYNHVLLGIWGEHLCECCLSLLCPLRILIYYQVFHLYKPLELVSVFSLGLTDPRRLSM